MQYPIELIQYCSSGALQAFFGFFLFCVFELCQDTLMHSTTTKRSSKTFLRNWFFSENLFLDLNNSKKMLSTWIKLFTFCWMNFELEVLPSTRLQFKHMDFNHMDLDLTPSCFSLWARGSGRMARGLHFNTAVMSQMTKAQLWKPPSSLCESSVIHEDEWDVSGGFSRNMMSCVAAQKECLGQCGHSLHPRFDRVAAQFWEWSWVESWIPQRWIHAAEMLPHVSAWQPSQQLEDETVRKMVEIPRPQRYKCLEVFQSRLLRFYHRFFYSGVYKMTW